MAKMNGTATLLPAHQFKEMIMNNNTVGVFVDVISIHRNLKYIHNGKLDYKKYMEKISTLGSIYRSVAYGSQIQDEAKGFISALRLFGLEPKYIPVKRENPQMVLRTVVKVFHLDDSDPIIEELKKKVNMEEEQLGIYSTDRTIDLMIDVFRIIHKLDTVVLGSSNINIIPLIEFIKEKGVKVVIFSSNIPTSVKNAANSWWEITQDLLERPRDE